MSITDLSGKPAPARLTLEEAASNYREAQAKFIAANKAYEESHVAVERTAALRNEAHHAVSEAGRQLQLAAGEP